MVELTAEQIAQRAFDLDLLDQRQLKEVWGAIGSREVSGDEFRQLLERRELLTNYQSERYCGVTATASSTAITRCCT